MYSKAKSKEWILPLCNHIEMIPQTTLLEQDAFSLSTDIFAIASVLDSAKH